MRLAVMESSPFEDAGASMKTHASGASAACGCGTPCAASSALYARDVPPVRGPLVEARVPCRESRQLGSLARQDEPAMQVAAERDVAHRQLVAGDVVASR